MKTKVNLQWYNQTAKSFKKGIVQEIILLRQQFIRYRDAINGKKHTFDIEHNIPTGQLFDYLNSAVHDVGKAEMALNNLLKTCEPDSTLKVNWKGIEQEIKAFAEKYNGILCTSDDKFLEFVAYFFCHPKYAVPDTEKNNDRLYKLLDKYKCCDDDLFVGYKPESFL